MAGVWSCGPGVDVGLLAEELTRTCGGAASVSEVGAVVLLDTADGALLAGRAALTADGSTVRLWTRSGVWRAGVEGAPERVEALPRGRLRDEVRRRIGRVELVSRLVVRRELTAVAAAPDRDGATLRLVAWYAEALAAAPSPLCVEVSWTGRAVEGTALRKVLARHGLRRGAVGGVDLVRATGLWGRSAKGMPLDPLAPAGVAVRRLLGGLREELRAQEGGVVAGDVEALHDWRVLLRSARALLGSVGDLLGPVAGRLRRQLRDLQQETGALRDLDVHIDQLDGSNVSLAEWLRVRQAEERPKVAKRLTSKRYRRILARWQELVEGDDAGPGATDAFAAVARILVWRAWGTLVARAVGVDEEATPELLHEVRKDGKRLRYVVELASAVLDDGAVKELLGRLKPLQSVLGTMQDLAVQRETLQQAGALAERELAAVVVADREVRGQAIEAIRAMREAHLDRIARRLCGLRGTVT